MNSRIKSTIGIDRRFTDRGSRARWVTKVHRSFRYVVVLIHPLGLARHCLFRCGDVRRHWVDDEAVI